jgi:hypothetical protein
LWFASADIGDLSRTLIRIRDDSPVTGLAEGAYTSFWSDPPTRARHVERSSLSIAACSRHSLPLTHCQEKRQNEAVTRKPLPTFFAGRGAFLGTNRLSLDYSCDQS